MATISVPDPVSNSSPMPLGDKVIRKELSIFPKSLYAPIYKWRRLLQVSGGSSLTLSSGPTNSIFNIPGGGVYNYAKSWLQWDLTLPAVATAATYNTVWADQVPIQDITLQTQTGQIVANLTGVPVYTKHARFLCTSMRDYLTWEPVRAAANAGGVANVIANAFGTINNCLQPSPRDYAATNTTANLKSVNVTSQYITSGAVVSPTAMTAAAGIDADTLSPQRLVTGAVYGAGPPVIGQLVVRYRIPLSAFVGTLLACDRNMYFGGQNMQLNINFSQLNKWGFNSEIDAVTNLTALTAGTFTNYYFYLCQEMCADNIDAAVAEVGKPGGLSLLIPYTICPKYAAGAAGLFTANTPLTAGMGILKRVITVVVDNTDLNTTTSNSDNVAGAKWTTIQSFLNNSPVQDWQLSVANGDDFNYLYNMIKDTPCGITSRIYRTSAFWCDNFSDADSGYMFPENDLMDSGHEISNSENYSIQFQLVGASQIYQFCTFSKRLIITNSVIQFA